MLSLIREHENEDYENISDISLYSYISEFTFMKFMSERKYDITPILGRNAFPCMWNRIN